MMNGSPPPRRSYQRRSYTRSRSPSLPRGRRGGGGDSLSYRRSDNVYRSRSKSRGGRSGSRSPMSGRRRHTGNRDNPNPNKCLGVFGLSLRTTERDIREVFGRYGPIEDCTVVVDNQTGRSRGFCFLYYENVEDAKAAKDACNGIEIDNRRIRVDFSITQRAHTPTPGIYMGKSTSTMDGKPRRGRRDDYRGGGFGGYGGHRSRRSPSPHYRRRSRYSRSPSFSPPPRKHYSSYSSSRSIIPPRRYARYSRYSSSRSPSPYYRHYYSRDYDPGYRSSRYSYSRSRSRSYSISPSRY